LVLIPYFGPALEGPVNSSHKAKAAFRHRSKACLLPLTVHGPKDGQELPTDGSIRLKRERPKLPLQSFNRPMGCHLHEVRLYPLVLFLLDPDMRVSATVAKRVATKADWRLPGIPNGASFFLEEWVNAMCGEKDEEPAKADVLEVCKARLLSPCPSPFGEIDLV